MSETRKPMTIHRLRAMRTQGEKIAMLTCYDAVRVLILVSVQDETIYPRLGRQTSQRFAVASDSG